MTTTLLTLEGLKAEFKCYADRGDPWGSTINGLFDVAESLFWHHHIDPPAHWEFSPGLGRGEPEGFAEGCDDADPEALLEFGEALHGLSETLRERGLDY